MRLWTVAIIFVVLGTGVSGRKSEECRQCEFTVDLLHAKWGENSTEECVGELATFICSTFEIEDHFVCKMIVSEFEPEAVYILGQIIVEPHQICGLLLDDCGTVFDPLNVTWHMDMPPNQPQPVEKQPVKPGNPKMKILHLTDIHMDSQYTPGTEAQCGEPQCCRPPEDLHELVSSAADIKQPAGKWGTVGVCDAPYWLVTNMLQFIQDNHKDLDYVLVSGDLMSHAVYEYTSTLHAAMIHNISATIKTYLPNVPVYFSVGNHEGVPIDNFTPHWAPKKFHENWLYDAMWDSWKGWLPQDQQTSVKYNGCYMVKMFPGLRLLSINNPLGGDRVNFWMYMNQTDPDGTLTWVVSQLLDAEKAGDLVHIVAHIPGGDGESLEGWDINYYNVMNRFQNTIAASFFGHTHYDEFYMVYENSSDATSRPSATVYAAPSVTTYSEFFPAYRIYTVDGNYPGSTYQVIDYEEWIFNVTEANQNPTTTPKWKQLFASINEEYGLNSQVPSEWNKFIDRMNADDSLFEKYITNYYRRNKYDGVTCDSKCKAQRLCKTRQFHHDKKLCADLGVVEDEIVRPKYRKQIKPKRLTTLEIIEAVSQRESKSDNPKCKM